MGVRFSHSVCQKDNSPLCAPSFTSLIMTVLTNSKLSLLNCNKIRARGAAQFTEGPASCLAELYYVLVELIFGWKGRNAFTLRHLQAFLVAFNDQVQNNERSKASIVEVVSCFATVEVRIQERQSDVHIKPSWSSTKKTQKARITTVIYSCQMYLYCTSIVLHIWQNGPLYLLNWMGNDENNWMGKWWTIWVGSAWEKRFC